MEDHDEVEAHFPGECLEDDVGIDGQRHVRRPEQDDAGPTRLQLFGELRVAPGALVRRTAVLQVSLRLTGRSKAAPLDEGFGHALEERVAVRRDGDAQPDSQGFRLQKRGATSHRIGSERENRIDAGAQFFDLSKELVFTTRAREKRGESERRHRRHDDFTYIIESGAVARPDTIQALSSRVLILFALLMPSAPAMGEKLPDYARAPKIARVSAAYKARMLCSAVFTGNRDPGAVERAELRRFPQAAAVDRERRTVSVKAGFGLPDQIAIYRPGLGCTAAIDYTLEHIEEQPSPELTPVGLPLEDPALLWPEGEAVSPHLFDEEIDRERLEAAIAETFTEPDRDRHRGTRAVVVVHKGRIVAERYADGFSQDTPLMGWSMAKSIVNALVGILVGDGRLSLESKGLLEEWRGRDDPRRAISLHHLLTMTSGQDFVEDYQDLLSDTPFMLSGTPDAARYASDKPLRDDPGEVWHYISGSPNIVCRLIRGAVGGSLADYWAFPRRSLFDRIGMRSAVLEPDASGTFLGSSLAYATARDWARFGLLYLRDGVWGSDRILPLGWVKYTTTPTPAAPRGEYGAYFWLNAGRAKAKPMFPSLPRDLYMALGYGGQNVIVIPSVDLVIVRLGSSEPATEGWKPEPFVAEVISAIHR